MTQQTLVGQIITYGTARGTTTVSVNSLSADGQYYNCTRVGSGEPFQVIRTLYDYMFLTAKKAVKPKGHKGRHKTGKQHYGLQNNISL